MKMFMRLILMLTAADDTKLVNKYDKQLEKLDAEILSMIKKTRECL